MLRKKEIVDINKMDRLQVLLFIIVILSASILIRLFYLQILNGKNYLLTAKSQHLLVADIRNGFAHKHLALDFKNIKVIDAGMKYLDEDFVCLGLQHKH